MNRVKTMKDIMVLRDLEQIKAISHPYRVEIIECFEGDEPKTAKQISELLEEPHAKINYHIKSLLKVGVLDLVDERIKSGIIEKYYLPAAKVLMIDKSFIKNGGEELAQSLSQAYISIFEKISSDFYKNIENLDSERFINQYSDYYLTKDEAKELMKKVESVMVDYLDGKRKKTNEDSSPYNFAVLGVSKVQKVIKEMEEPLIEPIEEV